MTASSLSRSQTFGASRGSQAWGMPGIIAKAAAPNRIKSAEAAGSRPDRKRGNQKLIVIPAPKVARATWYGSKPKNGSVAKEDPTVADHACLNALLDVSVRYV